MPCAKVSDTVCLNNHGCILSSLGNKGIQISGHRAGPQPQLLNGIESVVSSYLDFKNEFSGPENGQQLIALVLRVLPLTACIPVLRT